jgi:ADP-ribose pyrophosphatase YjhB (NUDIX family)
MNELIKAIEEYNPYDLKEKVDKEVILEFINNNEDTLTRNNRIAHFTTSAWIVNKEKTKVLMIFHNIYNSWAWVGGHADGDSNLLRVIKKEIEEETGVTKLKQLHDGIYGLNIITVNSHIKKGKVVNSHLHFDIEYLFEADEKQELRIKEDENSDVRWIDIDKVDEYCSEEYMKPIYRRITEKINK